MSAASSPVLRTRRRPSTSFAFRALTLKSFVDVGHVLVTPTERPGSMVDTALADQGLGRRVMLRTPHFLVAPLVVARSDLIATLPRGVARTFAAFLPLRVYRPPIDVSGFPMHMVWHPRSDQLSPHRWLRGGISPRAPKAGEPAPVGYTVSVTALRSNCVVALTVAAIAAVPAACASGARTPGSGEQAARASAARVPDRARDLVGLLPVGADRCVVARPAMLTSAQRQLFVRISQAEPFAWAPALRVTAYAGASRSDRSGRGSRVALLWVEGMPAEVRERFAEAAGVELSWEALPPRCGPDECPLFAHFVADHVLSIERGRWPEVRHPGAEQHCQRLSARSFRPVELSVSRNRRASLGGLMGLPLRTSSSAEASAGGVRMSRVDLMPSIEAAARAELEPALSDLLVSPLGGLATNLRRARVDAAMHTDFDVLWEDLEFARDDELRLAEAERHAETLTRMRPDGDVDLSRREVVLAQVGVRLDALATASGPGREALARDLLSLLERARALHAEDEGFAFIHAELLLAELGQPAAANALAEEFIARGASERFRRLRREAAARLGASQLTQALVADGLIKRGVSVVARSILEAMEAGKTYGDAERDALARQRAASRSRPPRERPQPLR